MNEHQSSKVHSFSLKPETNKENNKEEDQTNFYTYYSAIKKKKALGNKE